MNAKELTWMSDADSEGEKLQANNSGSESWGRWRSHVRKDNDGDEEVSQLLFSPAG